MRGASNQTLTAFIKQPHVSKILNENLTIPKNPIAAAPLLVPSTTSSPGTVATAFDLITRCIIYRKFKRHSVEKWHLGIVDYLQRPDDYVLVLKKEIEGYFKKGNITPDLLRACYMAAQIEASYRSGRRADVLGVVPEKAVQELEQLTVLLDIEKFRPNKRIYLNPQFATQGTRVRCAEGDLIIDETLIDIKTTILTNRNRYHWHQLVSYSVLAKLSGIDIQRIGIYYARQGLLAVFPLAEVIAEGDCQKITDIFKN